MSNRFLTISFNVFLILEVVFFTGSAHGQLKIKKITLTEALDIAREQAVDAVIARNTMKIAYWKYRNYRADLLPNVALSGVLPSYNRSLKQYQLEDGTYKFVSNNDISENLSLSISQNIPYTGGKISVETELQRIDQLSGKKSTKYLSVPGVITLTQPLITARPLRWAMKIEPTKYAEALQQFYVNMEGVALETIQAYFELLLATVNCSIAEQNLKNATELYTIALGKKKIGLISENDLQQLKLGKLNASAAVITARQNYDKKMFALCNYLGFDQTVVLEPEMPEECPDLKMSVAEVLEIAKKNNPFSFYVKRRALESKQQVAEAKASKGFQADIYASLGFTGSDTEFVPAYSRLENRQIVSLGVHIPLLDWGKGKGRVELAKSQQNVVTSQLEQEALDFEQQILINYNQCINQKELTQIYREADSVAQYRYKIAFETFVMGKINVLDINEAQLEENNAKRNYISQLYNSWYYYYAMRQATLFNFEDNKDILYSF